MTRLLSTQLKENVKGKKQRTTALTRRLVYVTVKMMNLSRTISSFWDAQYISDNWCKAGMYIS